MKTWLRHTLFTAAMLAGTAGVFAVNVIRKNGMEKFTCSKICIEGCDSLKYLSDDFIIKRISTGYGACVGKRLDSIDLAVIEKGLKALPVVRDCQVWITTDRMMHVSIGEREAIAKFQKGERGFYIDADSVIFPLSDRYEAPVKVVVGSFSEGDREGLMDLAFLCLRFSEDKKWTQQIDTIVLSPKGHVRIKPKESRVTYFLGNTSEVEEKIARMEIFRDRLASKVPDKDYTEVNVEFKNRIICK